MIRPPGAALFAAWWNAGRLDVLGWDKAAVTVVGMRRPAARRWPGFCCKLTGTEIRLKYQRNEINRIALGPLELSCYVYIDESGESGIAKVRDKTRHGASPYFVLAAAVMPRAVTYDAQRVLESVNSKIQKNWRHATDLSHGQTVYWSRRSTEVNLRYFAVISNKATLGAYSDRIEKDPQKFYNKCAVYLLERVGKYLLKRGYGNEPPTVVFETRNHDYDAMRRYISKIKDNPMHTDAKYLRVFNPFAIVTKSKDEEPLLKYADLASYAVYQCANKIPSNYSIPEPRYLSELSKRFGADEAGRVLGSGIKAIHQLEQLKLDPDVESLISSLKAAPLRR